MDSSERRGWYKIKKQERERERERETVYVIPDMTYDTGIFYTTVHLEQSNTGSEKASPPCLLLDLSMIVRNHVQEVFIGDTQSQDLSMCTVSMIPYVVSLCH